MSAMVAPILPAPTTSTECIIPSCGRPLRWPRSMQIAMDKPTESRHVLGRTPVRLVITMLDATDRALIALLRENARIGHAEAARRLKLSRTTVQARVESLERRGIIVGYTIRLAEEMSRRLVRAQVTIIVATKA